MEQTLIFTISYKFQLFCLNAFPEEIVEDFFPYIYRCNPQENVNVKSLQQRRRQRQRHQQRQTANKFLLENRT